jgi:hypothetical protein
VRGACTPCIFDVRSDPAERVNLANSSDPTNVKRLMNMTRRLLELKKTKYVPQYPPDNLTAACHVMIETGGFFGPWAEYPPSPPLVPLLEKLYNNTRLKAAHYNVPATFVCANAQLCLQHCVGDPKCGAIAYSEPYQPLKIPLPGCPGQRPGNIDGCCYPSPVLGVYQLLKQPGSAGPGDPSSCGTFGYVSAIVRYGTVRHLRLRLCYSTVRYDCQLIRAPVYHTHTHFRFHRRVREAVHTVLLASARMNARAANGVHDASDASDPEWEAETMKIPPRCCCRWSCGMR